MVLGPGRRGAEEELEDASEPGQPPDLRQASPLRVLGEDLDLGQGDPSRGVLGENPVHGVVPEAGVIDAGLGDAATRSRGRVQPEPDSGVRRKNAERMAHRCPRRDHVGLDAESGTDEDAHPCRIAAGVGGLEDVGDEVEEPGDVGALDDAGARAIIDEPPGERGGDAPSGERERPPRSDDGGVGDGQGRGRERAREKDHQEGDSGATHHGLIVPGPVTNLLTC